MFEALDPLTFKLHLLRLTCSALVPLFLLQSQGFNVECTSLLTEMLIRNRAVPVHAFEVVFSDIEELLALC